MNGSLLYSDGVRYAAYDMENIVRDLKIDEILQEMQPGKCHPARELFYQKPVMREDVLFRLSFMKELERPDVLKGIRDFNQQYEQHLTYLEYSLALSQIQTKRKWYLDAAVVYCESLRRLKASLLSANIQSEALLRFLWLLMDHMETADFVALDNDSKACGDRLDAIRYTAEVRLNQNKVKVSLAESGSGDYLKKLMALFSQYDLERNTAIIPFAGVNMGTLELCILEQLNALLPDAFVQLEAFCRTHQTIGSALVDRFYKELQFYLCYIGYMDRMRESGYPFCYPVITNEKMIHIEQGYDLTMAQSGFALSATDFHREDGQSFVITGPNQGGKTTYVRTIGQILYFASLGLPVPCRSVKTYFLEGLFTHFAKEEDLSKNAGRLKEELQRIKQILDLMPGDSLVIFNDVFSSTTTQDALQMGQRILARFIERGCLCLFVTHVQELARACSGMVNLCVNLHDGKKACTAEPGLLGGGNQWMDRYHLHYDEIRERIQ